MTSAILVNPNYPSARKVRYGMADDPVNPATVPATARRAGWAICILMSVVAALWASTLGRGQKPTSDLFAVPMSLLLASGLVAPLIARQRTRAEQAKGRRRIRGTGPCSGVAMTALVQMQRDATRFESMGAQQPRLAAMARDTAVSLGWLLWHCGRQVTEISAIEAEVNAAGRGRTGPAKTAWLAGREDHMRALAAPIVTAASEVRALADLAEDTVWSERLATEQATLEDLFVPGGPEGLASQDIAEATTVLRSWYSTWALLDIELQAVREPLARAAVSRPKRKQSRHAAC